MYRAAAAFTAILAFAFGSFATHTAYAADTAVSHYHMDSIGPVLCTFDFVTLSADFTKVTKVNNGNTTDRILGSGTATSTSSGMTYTYSANLLDTYNSDGTHTWDYKVSWVPASGTPCILENKSS
jgi:hypothetical protein